MTAASLPLRKSLAGSCAPKVERQNGADVICSSDGKLLSYDPIGGIRVRRPKHLAGELGLIDAVDTAARVT